MGADRPQPKEQGCIFPGGLFHHNIGSTHTEASPSSGLRGSQWERCGKLVLIPAHPPQLILIPPSGLSPCGGLRFRGQANLKTNSGAAFQSNEPARASDTVSASVHFKEIQNIIKCIFLIKPIVILLIGALKDTKCRVPVWKHCNYSHNVLLMPEQGSHARPCKGQTRTHTHACALVRPPPLPSAAPGITSVQSKAVRKTQHLRGDHTDSFAVSQPMEMQLQNVFLNREKQTRK